MVEQDKDGLIGTLVDPPLRLASVTLRDTNGSKDQLADFAPRKATALYFGFTHCNDVCPTTMADLHLLDVPCPTPGRTVWQSSSSPSTRPVTHPRY